MLIEQVKVLEGENSRQKQELGELHARICQEEQKEEEARHEVFTLKQRVLECDAGREAALNEVEGLWDLVCYQHARANTPLHTSYFKKTCHTHAESKNINRNTTNILLLH